MEIYVRNPYENYEIIAILDSFTSLIWTKRYYSCGDFELYLPADNSLLDILRPNMFLTRDDDDSVMVIESFNIKTDAESGDYFIVSGRSLESILYRRIFDRQFTLNNTGTLADAVQAMVTECTTNRDGTSARPRTYRQIPNLTVDTSTSFDGTMNVQFTGQTLLDGIFSVCNPRNIGVKMTLSSGLLLLSLYQGSEIETTFSTEFDNLVNSSYVYDITQYTNSIEVAGEGEGTDRKSVTRLFFDPENAPEAGLDLYESFVDARNISSNNGEIPISEYYDLLSEKAEQVHSERENTKSFEAEVEPLASFKYKTDWNLGDIVTVTNEYDITAYPRIVEVIESWDESGYKVIPTFDALEVSKRMILRDSDGYVLKDSTGAFICVRE